MFFVGLIVGIVVGLIGGYLYLKKYSTTGTFYINESDPKKDIFRLDFGENVDELYKKRFIFMRIKHSH